MKEETVEVNKGWLENLLQIAEMVEKTQKDSHDNMRDVRIASLLGYISSAKIILKFK